MNSESKCYCNKETFAIEKQKACHEQCNHPIPGEVLLKCNNGSLGPMTVDLTALPFSRTFNQPIASVTIDTSCLRCPNILISFDAILDISSLINNFIQSTFTFTLFKICKGRGVREALATFNYNVSELLFLAGFNFPISRTLCFQHSSCDDSCDDCCTYILELTRISDFNAVTEIISINGKLCALAVESPC